MLLANKGIIPPKEWYHNSRLLNNDHNTVAMHLASNGIIPPKEWYHNPKL